LELGFARPKAQSLVQFTSVEPAPPITEPPTGVPVLERVAAAGEVLLCSGFPTQLFIIAILALFGVRLQRADGGYNAPYIFALTLADTVLLTLLIWGFLRARRESFRDVLFGARSIGVEALIGVFLVPAALLIVLFVLVLLKAVAPSLHNVAHNPLADLARTRAQAIVFVLVVMIAGGVREEIQRGFILHRFEQFLGGGATGIVVFSLLFGLGHLEQGRDVALATAVLGAFWGVLYLRRRSIAAPMVSHAGFNLLQVLNFLAGGAG
jgi:membrane protease YdiL (CAAX protease family)